MNKIYFYLVIILACGPLCADEVVFGDNFQRGTLDTYLENAKSIGDKAVITTEKGVDVKVMKLTAPVSFILVPVNDKTKYQLTFSGRQQGVETIEENPRLSELIFNSRSFLPWYRLKFYDADRKEYNKVLPCDMGCDINNSPALAMPFGQWHEYKAVFYPPMNAAFMRFDVDTGAKGNMVSLADVKLAPAPDELAVNINPIFSYGSYNYSGWSGFNGVGRLQETEGGKTVLYSGFSAATTSFPLMEPGTYKIFTKGTGSIRNYSVFLIIIDADGKEISKIGEPVGKPKKASYEEKSSYFVLPKGAVRGYFTVYHSVLAELRLTRVGDEGKYKDVVKDKTHQ